jgi:hypothetical protein
MFTRALKWSLSWARTIKSISPNLISLRSILTLSFPPISWSSYLSLSFRLSHQNPKCIPLLTHARYMSYLSHPILLDHSNYTWRRVNVRNLLIMQFPPTSCDFVPLRSKYLPQHPVLEHPQYVFFP